MKSLEIACREVDARDHQHDGREHGAADNRTGDFASNGFSFTIAAAKAERGFTTNHRGNGVTKCPSLWGDPSKRRDDKTINFSPSFDAWANGGC